MDRRPLPRRRKSRCSEMQGSSASRSHFTSSLETSCHSKAPQPSMHLTMVTILMSYFAEVVPYGCRVFVPPPRSKMSDPWLESAESATHGYKQDVHLRASRANGCSMH
jgi:hypothetical protein